MVRRGPAETFSCVQCYRGMRDRGMQHSQGLKTVNWAIYFPHDLTLCQQIGHCQI